MSSQHPFPRKPDGKHQDAYAALEQMLARIAAEKLTGASFLRITHNQGGLTGIKINIEYEPKATSN